MKTPVLAALPLLAVAACAGETPEPRPIGMPNPASKYCIDIGGRSESRTAADGGQFRVCILPDGRTVEEWDLFRSAHPRP
jgi:putative hemolysin